MAYQLTCFLHTVYTHTKRERERERERVLLLLLVLLFIFIIIIIIIIIIYTNTYLHTCICICMSVCMYVYIYKNLHLYTILSCVCVCVCVCVAYQADMQPRHCRWQTWSWSCPSAPSQIAGRTALLLLGRKWLCVCLQAQRHSRCSLPQGPVKREILNIKGLWSFY